MVERCPACGARNPGAETCRRCGCALQKLVQLREAARQAERQAVGCLLWGEDGQARAYAEQAQMLDRQGLGAVLAGFVAWRRRNS